MGLNMPSHHQILRNASHADLISSRNGAYHKIWIANIKFEAELKGLRYICLIYWSPDQCIKKDSFRSAHDGLLDRINQVCAIRKASEPAGNSAMANLLPAGEPMPKFYDRKDFPSITVWTAAEWAVHPLNKKKVSQDVSIFPRRNPDIQTDRNNRESMYYLQDSQGQPVTQTRAAMICTTARGLFQHLRNQGMAPKSWSKRSDPAAQYFYREMVKFEPNFLMAEDHWKLERFAIDNYFNWSRQRKDTNDVKVEEGSTAVSVKKRKASVSAEIPTGVSKKSKILESSKSSESIKSVGKSNIRLIFLFFIHQSISSGNRSRRSRQSWSVVYFLGLPISNSMQ